MRFRLSVFRRLESFPFETRKSDATRTEPQRERENPLVNFRAEPPVGLSSSLNPIWRAIRGQNYRASHFVFYAPRMQNILPNPGKP